MIEFIECICNEESKPCSFTKIHDHKIEIDASIATQKAMTFKIVFSLDIQSFRNHDYKWVTIQKNHLANWYSPKIIKLQNNQIIQANQSTGIWEVDASRKNVLLWHINPPNSKPLVNYNANNSKQIIQAFSMNQTSNSLALLFGKDFGIEVSRSKIPFSAIACFTDHCDFDTLNNLRHQREFFKSHNIKLTKGFFLEHYSKRENTASIQYHEDELRKWIEDGHELAYHSLSQSIKPLDTCIRDFKLFIPPFKHINTWIDHGFQPYNFSLFKNNIELCDSYGSILKTKQITNLWNYVDSGTSVKGVINQINPNQFTLNTFYNGIKGLNIKTRMAMLIKCITFHYFNTDTSLRLYRSIAQYYKSIRRKKRFKRHLLIFRNVLKISQLLLPIGIFWKTKKQLVFPLAKYTPVIFNHDVSGESFTVFQTLEMIDFKIGLCKNNIDILIEESGLFIAHTYFSAPLNYHQGKLFGSIGQIDPQVEENFKYLSHKIQSKYIWNPTLVELSNYLKQLQRITYDCDQTGRISINNQNELEFRKVS